MTFSPKKWGILIKKASQLFRAPLFNLFTRGTVAGIAIKDYPILYCKRPILRVGVWPKWVSPAHSTLGQLTRNTSRLTHPKMSDFCPAVLKWHTFVFLRRQLWLILVLSWWLVKYKCVPFQNYWMKIANFLICYHWSVYDWLTKWTMGGANPYGPHPYPQNGSFTA